MFVLKIILIVYYLFNFFFIIDFLLIKQYIYIFISTGSRKASLPQKTAYDMKATPVNFPKGSWVWRYSTAVRWKVASMASHSDKVLRSECDAHTRNSSKRDGRGNRDWSQFWLQTLFKAHAFGLIRIVQRQYYYTG